MLRTRSKDSFTIMDEGEGGGQKDSVGKLKISSEMKEKLEVSSNTFLRVMVVVGMGGGGQKDWR
jgi:hypothetical protein